MFFGHAIAESLGKPPSGIGHIAGTQNALLATTKIVEANLKLKKQSKKMDLS
jgi:hypothetical protein